MRIEETQKILHESRILRNAHEGEVSSEGICSLLSNSFARLPALMNDRRFQVGLAAVAAVGLGVFALATSRRRSRRQ